MKKYLLIIILTVLFINASFSQNTGFPSEKMTIRLISGKEIKDARLWQLYADRLEYEQAGSLHDAMVASIEQIEADEAVYQIDSNMKLQKLPEDLIITNEQDTIRCLIKEIRNDPPRIFYHDRKNKVSKHVSLSIVKKYSQHAMEYTASPQPGSVENAADTCDYNKLGRDDAKKYYDGTGAFIGGLFGVFFLGPIIAAIPPQNVSDRNPHADLYYNNNVYRSGYRKAAHTKKAGNALGGMGTALLFLLVVAF